MKKIVWGVLLLILACIAVQGCKKEIKISDDEKITKYELRYCVDKDKPDSKYLNLAIDFEEEEPSVIIGMTDGNQFSYVVNNEEVLVEYLRETFSYSDYRKRSINSEGLVRFIWFVDIETDKARYGDSGYGDYPAYWDELFQVLIETTEAESLEDFGFGNADKFETYNITEKVLNESNEKYIKEIKYPYLDNEKDFFKDINDQMVDVINNFDIFRMSDDSEIQWSYWNTYKVTENKTNIRVEFYLTAYPVGNPKLEKAEYVVNIDLINGKVVNETSDNYEHAKEIILEALTNQDKELFKSVLADSTLTETPNLDAEIQCAFDMFKGEIIEVREHKLSDDEVELDNEKINATFVFYDVVTSEQEYLLDMMYIPGEGIYYVMLADYDRDYKYFTAACPYAFGLKNGVFSSDLATMEYNEKIIGEFYKENNFEPVELGVKFDLNRVGIEKIEEMEVVNVDENGLMEYRVIDSIDNSYYVYVEQEGAIYRVREKDESGKVILEGY